MASVQEFASVGQPYQLIPQVVTGNSTEGGVVFGKSLNTSLDICYSNISAIIKTTNFKLRPDYCRICHPLMAMECKNTRTKNIQLHDPVKIRADSQV
jgi:hypothetical protein